MSLSSPHLTWEYFVFRLFILSVPFAPLAFTSIVVCCDDEGLEIGHLHSATPVRAQTGTRLVYCLLEPTNELAPNEALVILLVSLVDSLRLIRDLKHCLMNSLPVTHVASTDTNLLATIFRVVVSHEISRDFAHHVKHVT